tara:strand:- start:2648 stop:3694 length:1047 start_codon:yes stop_codon:yes gene_type:complete
MAAGLQPLTLIQVGKESTDGTAVAATRRILTKSGTYRHMQTQEMFEGQLSGTLARSATSPVLTREASQLEISTDLDFNQVLLPLLSGVKGGVTPSTPGTGEARLWTFAPSQTAPSVDPYTIEMVVDDGSTKQEIEAPFGVTTSFEITGGVDALPQITWSMDARKSVQSTYTSGIALPAVEFASNLRWMMTLDTTWANLGNTNINGQVYGFTWGQSALVMPQYYLQNRDALDFAGVEPQTRTTDLVIQATLDTGGSNLYETELAAKALGSKRFIQLRLQGAAFASPDSGRYHNIDLKGSFVHADDSMQDIGADRDGNSVVSLHLVSQYDSTSGQDVEYVVQNKLTSFPA